MADVILKGLVKLYPATKGNPAFQAVKGIDLSIRDGEFMVFVGPSGCGKSTTLRMIAGLESITEGEIHIGNRCVNAIQPKDRDISMVFQNYALYPHKSVYDNMAFGLEMMGCKREEIRNRVNNVAASLGLTPVLKRKPAALSGGQRQRVALGRAIVRQPKVFLFDEPLSNLDAKMRVSTRSEISGLHKKLGATMIYVTHDQVEAMTMGDRICVMNAGKIIQVDEPLKLFNEPANLFVAGFIGSPSMNFIHGKLRFKDNVFAFEENNATSAQIILTLSTLSNKRVGNYVDKDVILGIRPESIYDPESVIPESLVANIESKLLLAEPMGTETYLKLDTGSHVFTARVKSSYNYFNKPTVPLAVDLNAIHLFDPVTEARI